MRRSPYGLGYPDRIESNVASLDFLALAKLEFAAPDMVKFPCLRLAYDALKQGGTAPAILNAANEIAVQSFLDKKISFMEIPQVIEFVLNATNVESVESIEQLINIDMQARKSAEEAVMTMTRSIC